MSGRWQWGQFQFDAAYADEYSDAALSGDCLIGSIDGGDFLGRDGHKFGWNAASNHLVRMIVDHELAVVNFQRIIAGLGRDTQNFIRILLGGSGVAHFDVAELNVCESEAPGYFSQKLFLVGMEHPVRHGDVEETFQHVL